MSDDVISPLRIAHHTLRIADPAASMAFYIETLGMTLHARANSAVGETEIQHYFVGFTRLGTDDKHNHNDLLDHSNTLIELTHRSNRSEPERAARTSEKAGYWKIGITLADVDLAREHLIDAGVVVSQPKQFLDVGYLCHLHDPDGYSIELLQHRFAQNHRPNIGLPAFKLRSEPTLGQITFRVKDPEISLRFYLQGLGMRLLSRQVVEPHRFTLYFLACTGERPPHPDIDAVKNREWLWQRPYTVLELQHVWGTESGQFRYRVTADTGFERISFAARDANSVLEKLSAVKSPIDASDRFDTSLGARTITLVDPDGYAIRIIETG